MSTKTVSPLLHFSLMIVLVVGATVFIALSLLNMKKIKNSGDKTNLNPFCLRSSCSTLAQDKIPITDDWQKSTYRRLAYCVGNGPSAEFESALQRCVSTNGVDRAYFKELLTGTGTSRIEYYKNWWNDEFLSEDGCPLTFNNNSTDGPDIEANITEFTELINACAAT